MAANVFSSVFNNIDQAVLNIISGNIANFFSIFSPVLLAAFTVYVIFVFWSYFGTGIESMFDILKRIIAWMVILTFSINIGSYTSNVVPLVLHLGDGMAQAFSGHATDASALDSLVKLLADMIDENTKAVPPLDVGSSVRNSINNSVLTLVFGLFLVIAAAYLILAKTFLAILAVVGPIFVALALFPATRQFFSAWVNQVVNYSFYFLLVNIVGSILLNYVSITFNSTDAISNDGIIHIVLVMLVFAIIMLKLPELASGLAGGIAGNGFGALAHTASSAGRLAGAFKSKGGDSSSSGGSMKAEGAGNAK